jgi:hypothetical protein
MCVRVWPTFMLYWGGSVEDSGHLGCDTVSLDEWFLTFCWIVVPLSALVMRFERNYWPVEDEGGGSLQNGRKPLPNNTVSHPRQAESSIGLLWELLQRLSSYLTNVDSFIFTTGYSVIVKRMICWGQMGRNNQWKNSSWRIVFYFCWIKRWRGICSNLCFCVMTVVVCET